MTRHSETPLHAPVAAAVDAREPASPRLLPVRAGWQRVSNSKLANAIRTECRWLNDSSFGDAIGLVCVIATFLIFYVLTA